MGEFFKVGEKMIYCNYNTDKDKNKKNLLEQIDNLDLRMLNNQEIKTLADNLFKLFKKSFESNSYIEMDNISKKCKEITTSFLINKFKNDEYYIETVIDIACFVFEQMYMYDEKVSVLKTVIKLDTLNKTYKVRAIEELLSPEPEIQQLILAETDELRALLNRLLIE